jgi:hypothetical protein
VYETHHAVHILSTMLPMVCCLVVRVTVLTETVNGMCLIFSMVARKDLG